MGATHGAIKKDEAEKDDTAEEGAIKKDEAEKDDTAEEGAIKKDEAEKDDTTEEGAIKKDEAEKDDTEEGVFMKDEAEKDDTEEVQVGLGKRRRLQASSDEEEEEEPNKVQKLFEMSNKQNEMINKNTEHIMTLLRDKKEAKKIITKLTTDIEELKEKYTTDIEELKEKFTADIEELKKLDERLDERIQDFLKRETNLQKISDLQKIPDLVKLDASLVAELKSTLAETKKLHESLQDFLKKHRANPQKKPERCHKLFPDLVQLDELDELDELMSTSHTFDKVKLDNKTPVAKLVKLNAKTQDLLAKIKSTSAENVAKLDVKTYKLPAKTPSTELKSTSTETKIVKSYEETMQDWLAKITSTSATKPRGHNGGLAHLAKIERDQAFQKTVSEPSDKWLAYLAKIKRDRAHLPVNAGLTDK